MASRASVSCTLGGGQHCPVLVGSSGADGGRSRGSVILGRPTGCGWSGSEPAGTHPGSARVHPPCGFAAHRRFRPGLCWRPAVGAGSNDRSRDADTTTGARRVQARTRRRYRRSSPAPSTVNLRAGEHTVSVPGYSNGPRLRSHPHLAAYRRPSSARHILTQAGRRRERLPGPDE
jgi:hypothetical protein